MHHVQKRRKSVSSVARLLKAYMQSKSHMYVLSRGGDYCTRCHVAVTMKIAVSYLVDIKPNNELTCGSLVGFS